MYFAVILLATLFASAHGLATPLHGARFYHRHANIAKARAPAPEPSAPVEFFSKRGLKKRCKARVTSGLAIPTGVGNVASDPADVSASVSVAIPPVTSTAEPEKTTSSSPPKPTTTKASPPPPPSPSPPPPKPTTTSKTTSTAPQPTSGGGGDDGFGTLTGDGTFYNTGLTACGVTNTDSQFIAAVSHDLFDTFPGYNGVNPNNNPICGRKVVATYQGKSVTVTITDRCTGCQFGDLDFSPSAFNQLSSPDVGRIHGMTWHFV